MGKKKLLLSISITLASIGMLMANSDDLFKKADEDHERIVEMQTQYVRSAKFYRKNSVYHKTLFRISTMAFGNPYH